MGIKAKAGIMEKYGEAINWQSEHILPHWVLDNMDITITQLAPRKGTFKLAYNPVLFRRFPPPHDVEYLSGQAVMALADSLLIFPIVADIGHGQEVVTLDLSTQFLKPVHSGEVRIEANVIQHGRRSMRGVVDIYDEDNRHCATSMVCYMFV